jgi:hypothetical protein
LKEVALWRLGHPILFARKAVRLLNQANSSDSCSSAW